MPQQLAKHEFSHYDSRSSDPFWPKPSSFSWSSLFPISSFSSSFFLELLPLDLFRLGLLRLELVGLEAVVHEQGPLQCGDPVADQVATLHLGGNSMKPSSAHSGLPATAVAPPSGSCRGSLSRTS